MVHPSKTCRLLYSVGGWEKGCDITNMHILFTIVMLAWRGAGDTHSFTGALFIHKHIHYYSGFSPNSVQLSLIRGGAVHIHAGALTAAQPPHYPNPAVKLHQFLFDDGKIVAILKNAYFTL